MDIRQIQTAVATDHLRITDHADEEMAADGLTLSDVIFSANRGEIIEDCPTDHPLPSCLILGKAIDESPIHSVWA